MRVLSRLRDLPSDRRIASSMAWVSVFGVVSGLALIARDAAIANRFGVSAVVDAYVLVFTALTWLPSVWTSVLAVVLVPLLAKLSALPAGDQHTFIRELGGLALILGTALAGLALLASSPAASLAPLHLPQETELLVREFLRLMFPVTLLCTLIGLVSTRLLSLERHSNTLLQGIPPLVVMGAVLVLPGSEARVLSVSTLAGFALLLLVAAIHLQRRESLGWPRLSLLHSEWSPFWRSIGLVAIGQLLMGSTVLVDQAMAARLGEGSVATLGYANRVIALFLGLGAIAAARPILPVLSRAVAEGDLLWAERHAIRWSWILFFLGAAVALLGLLLGPAAIRLVFQHGAFDDGHTQAVSHVFAYGLAQVPFFFSAIVLVQWFAARGLQRTIALSGLVGLTVKITGNLFLIPFLGVAGITLASALMYASTFVLFVLSARVSAEIGRSGSR